MRDDLFGFALQHPVAEPKDFVAVPVVAGIASVVTLDCGKVGMKPAAVELDDHLFLIPEEIDLEALDERPWLRLPDSRSDTEAYDLALHARARLQDIEIEFLDKLTEDRGPRPSGIADENCSQLIGGNHPPTLCDSGHIFQIFKPHNSSAVEKRLSDCGNRNPVLVMPLDPLKVARLIDANPGPPRPSALGTGHIHRFVEVREPPKRSRTSVRHHSRVAACKHRGEKPASHRQPRGSHRVNTLVSTHQEATLAQPRCFVGSTPDPLEIEGRYQSVLAFGDPPDLADEIPTRKNVPLFCL